MSEKDLAEVILENKNKVPPKKRKRRSRKRPMDMGQLMTVISNAIQDVAKNEINHHQARSIAQLSNVLLKCQGSDETGDLESDMSDDEIKKELQRQLEFTASRK